MKVRHWRVGENIGPMASTTSHDLCWCGATPTLAPWEIRRQARDQLVIEDYRIIYEKDIQAAMSPSEG